MPGSIPDARFRLSQTFSVLPQLECDSGPSKDLLIGQNSQAEDIEAIYVGKHAETPHRGVWMDIRGAHVLYVMGKRRSGKSYTLGAIAEGLVADSWVRQGTMKPGVLILDTMNVFLTMPFSVKDSHSPTSREFREMKKWKLGDEALDFTLFAPRGSPVPSELEADTITLRASDLTAEEWCALFAVDPFVDPMGHLITTLYARITTEGMINKTSGQRIAPRSEFTIENMAEALTVDVQLDEFSSETREALRRRLEALARLPLFSKDGLDIRRLIRPGSVSILLLRDLDPDLRAVMVALIVKRMMQLRAVSEQQERVIPIHLARADKYSSSDPKRAAKEREIAKTCRDRALEGLPRAWLIIDEAHNYVPARSNAASRKPLKKYVDEGRNLGLSIVVATQQPSGLDPSIQRNADMLLVHALSHHDDIAAAQGMLNTALPDEATADGKYKYSGNRSFEMMVRRLPLGYALASTDRANRLFPVRIRPRSTIHGGGDY